MLCIGVVRKKTEKLAEIIADGLMRHDYDLIYMSKKSFFHQKGKRREEIILIASDDLGFSKFIMPDLIVFSPECGEKACRGTKAACRAAIMPGDMSVQAAPAIKADYIISYGMSPKNTATVSSINDESTVLSIQREIIDLKNKKIERQEIPLNIGGEDYKIIMAASAALILSGVPVSALGNTFIGERSAG